MASYTILTTRQQEIGLKFSYDTYADKTVFTTQAAYFQDRINQLVTNPMWAQQQASQAKNFNESFKTIPEAEQPAAQVEIEGVITAHGGEIVTTPPVVPPVPQTPVQEFATPPDLVPPPYLPITNDMPRGVPKEVKEEYES